jgi:hypothetical protein
MSYEGSLGDFSVKSKAHLWRDIRLAIQQRRSGAVAPRARGSCRVGGQASAEQTRVGIPCRASVHLAAQSVRRGRVLNGPWAGQPDSGEPHSMRSGWPMAGSVHRHGTGWSPQRSFGVGGVAYRSRRPLEMPSRNASRSSSWSAARARITRRGRQRGGQFVPESGRCLLGGSKGPTPAGGTPLGVLSLCPCVASRSLCASDPVKLSRVVGQGKKE